MDEQADQGFAIIWAAAADAISIEPLQEVVGVEAPSRINMKPIVEAQSAAARKLFEEALVRRRQSHGLR